MDHLPAITPLLAEVLDKEPSLAVLAAPFLLVAVVGFALASWRWQLVVIPIATALPLALFTLSEIFDRFVGPAIWRESPLYYVTAVVSASLAFALPALGAIAGWRRMQSKENGT